MTTDVLIASNNAHKLQEMREIFALAGAGDLIRLHTPNELVLTLDPDETADTYTGNAQIKAREFAALVQGRGLWVMADDSGLEVDALGGRPGVKSARYHKAAPNADGCAALLLEMTNVLESQRTARFHCVIALISPAGDETIFHGICEGRIGLEKRGQNGFGFDPVFVTQSGAGMAELSSTEKHAISHRGMAARQVAAHLREKDRMAE
jgi:XTP/dITP diphosphohydrolase